MGLAKLSSCQNDWVLLIRNIKKGYIKILMLFCAKLFHSSIGRQIFIIGFAATGETDVAKVQGV